MRSVHTHARAHTTAHEGVRNASVERVYQSIFHVMYIIEYHKSDKPQMEEYATIQWKEYRKATKLMGLAKPRSGLA